MYYVRTFKAQKKKKNNQKKKTKKKTDMKISTLKNCQSEFNFTNMWEKAKLIS